MTNKLFLIAIMSAATISGKSFATTNGFYISAQGGYNLADYNDSSHNDEYAGPSTVGTTTAKYTYDSSHTRAEAIRIALGYDFNRYIGLEIGGSRYATSTLNSTIVSKTTDATLQSSEMDLKPIVMDLLFKGTLPIGKTFLYAKGGLAAVYAQYDINSETAQTPTGTNIEKDSTREHSMFYRPEVVLGAGFNINENFALDLSYSRIFGTGSIADTYDYLPNLDYMAIGITFRFE